MRYPALGVFLLLILIVAILVWTLVPQPLNKTYTYLLLLAAAIVAGAVQDSEITRGPSKQYDVVGLEGCVTSVEPLTLEVQGSSWQGEASSGTGLQVGKKVRVIGRKGLTLLVAASHSEEAGA